MSSWWHGTSHDTESSTRAPTRKPTHIHGVRMWARADARRLPRGRGRDAEKVLKCRSSTTREWPREVIGLFEIVKLVVTAANKLCACCEAELLQTGMLLCSAFNFVKCTASATGDVSSIHKETVRWFLSPMNVTNDRSGSDNLLKHVYDYNSFLGILP